MDFSRKGVVISRTNLIENKKKISFPWRGILAVIVTVGGLWIGGRYYLDYSKKELAELKSNLANLRTGRDYEKMALIADSTSRLFSIDSVLKDRFDWKKLFLELEKNTIGEVTFDSMTANYSNQESSASSAEGSLPASKKCILTLDGTTMGIANVSRQVSAFKDEKNLETSFAEKIKLNQVGLNEASSFDGSTGTSSANFSLSLEVNPKIFVSEDVLEN